MGEGEIEQFLSYLAIQPNALDLPVEPPKS